MIERLKQDVIYRKQITQENIELHKEFQNKINILILKTPTGELRNELTELNMLFDKLIDNTNKLI